MKKFKPSIHRILILDNKPLNHFVITNHCKRTFTDAAVSHSYSTEEAIELLSREKRLPELILVSLPQVLSDQFFSKYHSLPDSIQKHCRVVIFNPYFDPGIQE